MPFGRVSGGLLVMLMLSVTALTAGAARPAASAGALHSVALRADGTILSWGYDGFSQLGVGRSGNSALPLAVHPVTDVIAVAAGSSYSAALRRDGTVWSWGLNDAGQLGDGTTINRPRAVQARGLAGVIAISAKSRRTLALRNDGTVWAWGAGNSTPVRVAGLSAIRAVYAGSSHSFALGEDGTLWAWGANASGQLGDGTTIDRHEPVRVVGASGVTFVSAATGHSAARRADGTLLVWGADVGDGLGGDRSLPQHHPAFSGVVAIASGVDYTLVLTDDGHVVAWGAQPSVYISGADTGPLRTVWGLPAIAGVAAADAQAFAIGFDGSVWGWGSNLFGELGNGTTDFADAVVPVQVVGLTGITMLAAGASHTIAMRSDRTLWAWGQNYAGAFGDGGASQLAVPTPVGLQGVTAIVAAGTHSVALRDDGTVWTWGFNSSGELGDATPRYTSRGTPARVEGIEGVVAIAADSNPLGGLTLALKQDGTVWSWGRGSTSPMQVAGLSDVAAIATASSFTVVAKRDGSVWTWGSNYAGQLGDGTTESRETPMQVPGLTDVAEVRTGFAHVIARRTDGTVWSWGNNQSGQLGDGTLVDKLRPVSIPGLSGVTSISTHAAVKADGTVWTWGGNNSGERGDGTTEVSLLPTPVPGLKGMTSVSGQQHLLAVREDGTLWSWGRNLEGALGDGSFVSRRKVVVTVAEGGGGTLQRKDWFLDLDPARTKDVPADQVPPFLAVASGAIADDVASFSTKLQVNPDDAETAENVYVFALAPARLVEGAIAAKETIGQCVLAQMSTSGKLVAVSASQIAAAISGIVAGQDQSIHVLDNVPVPGIAGATFFVGYGRDPQSMLDGGVNRSTVTIPGETRCEPQVPETGWWWNPREDGRGYSIEVQGRNLLFASFLYDVSGRSTWYVASGRVSLDGSLFSSTLFSARGGQTLGGTYTGMPSATAEGSVALAFSSARQGTLLWPGGLVPIERFNITPGGLQMPKRPGAPESGWWWNEQESGRGFFMEWQGDTIDLAGYMYDDAGNPVWYVSVGSMSPGSNTYRGTWWSFGNGQTLRGSWQPSARLSDNVAPVTIEFSALDAGLMTLPNGRTTRLTRHRF